jgi:hypothetical protein
MNNKVYNVDIRELMKTLAELAEQYKYADFEIESIDLDTQTTKLLIYPVSFTSPQPPKLLGDSKLDPSEDLDDLVDKLT